jgi:hypothetical protein
MKAFITPSYTFTPGPSGSGTVDLSSISGFDVKKLSAIINQTRGVPIYATTVPNLKFTAASSGIITLFADTSDHLSTDILQVVYEDPALEEKLQAGNESLEDILAKLDASIAVTGTFWPETQPVSLASPVTVNQTALVASYQEIINLTSIAQTFTAPAGAKWCKVYAEDGNSANIRVKIGGTASTTSGLQLQPGRAEDFMVAGDVSVIAESGFDLRVNVHFGA